jgi:hypothetical protein
VKNPLWSSKLNAALAASKMSKRRAARLVGVPRSTFQSWCLDGCVPPNGWEVLPRLAEVLGCRIRDLIPGVE